MTSPPAYKQSDSATGFCYRAACNGVIYPTERRTDSNKVVHECDTCHCEFVFHDSEQAAKDAQAAGKQWWGQKR